ncbi:transposase [Enterococcus sp. ALS3]|uniref:Transposase n=1 Tax=Enterococcus alishanensis TaxID=1303817 RepID=A0ABS6TH85_9ENTE|nr:transposase [Enterococcus alishanensis]
MGIDIRRHQSGTFMCTDRINKRGNPNARRVFYFVVTNMLKQQRWGPNHIVDYYYKLKEPPYSKKHNVATIACINKLIKCLYAMVIKGSIYDYHLASVSQQ